MSVFRSKCHFDDPDGYQEEEKSLETLDSSNPGLHRRHAEMSPSANDRRGVRFTKSGQLPSSGFTYTFLVFWLALLALVALFPRGTIELSINRLSHPFLDSFFLCITFMGNGWFAAGLVLLFLFVDYRKAAVLLLTLLVVVVLTNIFKRFIFLQHMRPMWHFSFIEYHRVLFDAPIHYLRSFPSGHTMTIFAMTVFFSLEIKKRSIDALLILLAILVSFSRIYLLQHYLVDVLWGALLGVFSGITGYWTGINYLLPSLAFLSAKRQKYRVKKDKNRK